MVNKKGESLDELKPSSSGADEVFKRHKKRLNDESFKRFKRLNFNLSIFFGFFIIIGFYFLTDISNIKAIVVEGNNYLSSEYIKKISELTLDSKFYLTPWFLVENTIKKDGLISNVKVSFEKNNVILINVTEKRPVGYRYLENAEILLEDGKIVNLTSDYMPIVSRIPLITGFIGEDAEHLITKSLSKVDKDVIEGIAEISQYQLNYDENALQVIMRDGNYFFASYYSLEFINNYNFIASELDKNGICLFADESLKVAYRKACPWDEVKVNLEYWKNESGEYIINKYGDKVVIHYYTDDKGNPILDEAGNKIPIPINALGEEIPATPLPEEENKTQTNLPNASPTPH